MCSVLYSAAALFLGLAVVKWRWLSENHKIWCSFMYSSNNCWHKSNESFQQNELTNPCSLAVLFSEQRNYKKENKKLLNNGDVFSLSSYFISWECSKEWSRSFTGQCISTLVLEVCSHILLLPPSILKSNLLPLGFN